MKKWQYKLETKYLPIRHTLSIDHIEEEQKKRIHTTINKAKQKNEEQKIGTEIKSSAQKGRLELKSTLYRIL